MAFAPVTLMNRSSGGEFPGSGHSHIPGPWHLLEAVELLGIWLLLLEEGPTRVSQEERLSQGPQSINKAPIYSGKLKDAFGEQGLILYKLLYCGI